MIVLNVFGHRHICWTKKNKDFRWESTKILHDDKIVQFNTTQEVDAVLWDVHELVCISLDQHQQHIQADMIYFI